MTHPAVFAVDESRDTLGLIGGQLIQRYAHDYRVMCLGDAGVALQKLTELAHAGEDVALVLAGMPRSATANGGLLGRVRELHPHAKRALLVPPAAWTDKPSAEVVRTSIASGGADYYVIRPAASPDEVFHEMVSGFSWRGRGSGTPSASRTPMRGAGSSARQDPTRNSRSWFFPVAGS